MLLAMTQKNKSGANMDINKLIFNVAILFLMMIPGVIMKKCRLCDGSFGKGLSNLVLYIAQPALIVFAYIDFSGGGIWLNALWVLLLSILAHVIFAIPTLMLFKNAPDGRRRMLRFATIFSNAAFMGIPLISAVIGAEATIYASIYNITFNMFLWSLGVYLCTADRDEDGDGLTDGDPLTEYNEHKTKNPISWVRVIFHPVNVASFVGIFILATGISAYIPTIVSDSFEMLKNLVAPLSMTVLGLRMANMDFRGIFRDTEMYKFLFLRHIGLPLLVLVFIKLISLVGVPLNDTVCTCVMIMASAPAATSATMFAEKYDCDAMYVSRIVAVSTLISVATMPIIMYIYGYIM